MATDMASLATFDNGQAKKKGGGLSQLSRPKLAVSGLSGS